MMGPIPALRIRPADVRNIENPRVAHDVEIYQNAGYELWLFLDHGGEHTLLDERWAVGYRAKDGWWGMVALAADTHEGAVVRLAVEALYASVAIGQLQRERAH